jgi:hypothetical protein
MALIIHIETGEPIFGLWCPHCLLPSGFELPICSVSEFGVGSLGSVKRYYDCERPL